MKASAVRSEISSRWTALTDIAFGFPCRATVDMQRSSIVYENFETVMLIRARIGSATCKEDVLHPG